MGKRDIEIGRDHHHGQPEVLEAVGQVVVHPAVEVRRRGAHDQLVELAVGDGAMHRVKGIVAGGQADAVALARAMLYEPRWPWHAAAALGAQVQAPPQYWRSQPREFKELFAGFKFGAR